MAKKIRKLYSVSQDRFRDKMKKKPVTKMIEDYERELAAGTPKLVDTFKEEFLHILTSKRERFSSVNLPAAEAVCEKDPTPKNKKLVKSIKKLIHTYDMLIEPGKYIEHDITPYLRKDKKVSVKKMNDLFKIFSAKLREHETLEFINPDFLLKNPVFQGNPEFFVKAIGFMNDLEMTQYNAFFINKFISMVILQIDSFMELADPDGSLRLANSSELDASTNLFVQQSMGIYVDPEEKKAALKVESMAATL